MVDIFEKNIHLAWYPDERRWMSFCKISDEIIRRPGDLKSQRLQISHDETCEESAHLLLKEDEQDMDVFDAVW